MVNFLMTTLLHNIAIMKSHQQSSSHMPPINISKTTEVYTSTKVYSV